MSQIFDHGGTVFAVARQLGVAPHEILDFSASINPLGPSDEVRRALVSAMAQLVHYPDSEATELQQALANHHQLPVGTVCVGNGSTALIHLLPRLVRGKRGLIVAPAFSEYEKALAKAEWEISHLCLRPEDGFVLPFDKLERCLKGGCELLFLANPGNPTGRLYRRDEVAEVQRLCAETGTFLLLDEAFIDFCPEESSTHVAPSWENGIALRSLTKYYAIPGLRLGYAVGPAPLIARLQEFQEPWSVNTLAQAAGMAALADESYRQLTRKVIDLERRHLGDRLAAIPGLQVFPGAANYLLVGVGRDRSVNALCRRLHERRIMIRDCASFRGLGEGFFRVAVRGRQDNDRLLTALGELMGTIPDRR